MLDLFRNRKKSIHLAVLIALMVALLAPVGAAYADGEPPPEPPPVEEVVGPEPIESTGEDGNVDETDSSDPSDLESNGDTATQLAEALEGEEAAAENEGGTEAEIDSTSPKEETLPNESIEEADENLLAPSTSVGPLALVAVPDPYFTLGGDVYSFYSSASACGGALNCWDGLTTPIQNAIDYLSGSDAVPDDNTVYVEAGTYTEDDTIDGTDWITTPAQLILQGVSGSGMTTIDGSLIIQNMLDFILRGFTVTGGVSATSNTGTLTIDDVVVDGVPTPPPDTNGLTVSGQTGDVQVTNSSFNNNPGSGMVINASGSVLVEDVEASGNLGGDGATIIANAITVRRSVFNNNTDGDFGPTPDDPGQGLFIRSNGGPILVENVTAMGNEESGGYFFHNSSNPANEITVVNSSFKNNGRFGVYAQPNGGTVTFNCIHKYGNAHGGTLVPIGETVVWIKCECKEKHEK